MVLKTRPLNAYSDLYNARVILSQRSSGV